MIKNILFLFFVFILSVPVAAQDTKITIGIVNYDDRDFDAAVKSLEEGLKEIDLVKEKNRAKGYYYYGKALIGQLQQAVASNDDKKVEACGNNLLLANAAFKNAKKYDDGKLYDQINKELNLLFSAFLQSGLQALNSAYDMTDLQQRSELLNATKEYAVICSEINPDSYVSYDILGQAELGMLDSSNAYKSFALASQKYQNFRPSAPDLMVAYVFYRIALLDKYMKKDIDASLSDISNGKQVLEQEWGRLKPKLNEYTDAQKTALTAQYNNALSDLERFEMDILLNSPEKLEEALKKFEEESKKHPDDYMIYLAYAQLLEKTDRDKAIAIYEKATEIDPNQLAAYFNLGALYNNMAAEYYNQANETTDYESAKPFEQKGREYMAQAYPNFQKANIIAPTDVTIIRALMQIALTLEKMDDYNQYKANLKALGN